MIHLALNIIRRGLTSSSKYSKEKYERAILILLTARFSFGVGGSGRSPVNPPTPRVRRAGRQGESGQARTSMRERQNIDYQRGGLV